MPMRGFLILGFSDVRNAGGKVAPPRGWETWEIARDASSRGSSKGDEDKTHFASMLALRLTCGDVMPWPASVAEDGRKSFEALLRRVSWARKHEARGPRGDEARDWMMRDIQGDVFGLGRVSRRWRRHGCRGAAAAATNGGGPAANKLR
jgi:hypothetical protein